MDAESGSMSKLSQLRQEKEKQASEQEDIVGNYDKLVKDRDEEERLRKEERQRKCKEHLIGYDKNSATAPTVHNHEAAVSWIGKQALWRRCHRGHCR